MVPGSCFSCWGRDVALTIRERLLAAAYAKLAAISGVAGLSASRVERNRRDEVVAFPFIVSRDGGDRVLDRLVGMDRWSFALDVELYADGATAAAAGTKLNELHGAAAAALLADISLGVGGFDVRLVDTGDPIIDASDGADPVASMVARYELEAWLRPDDPFTLAP